jgi:DNA-binding transcriptional ArsR family regulator
MNKSRRMIVLPEAIPRSLEACGNPVGFSMEGMCFAANMVAWILYFDKNRNMEMKSAVTALAALAQESRLAVFRLLVQAGPEGLSVGRIGEALGIPPSSLSFHMKELSHAGLVSSRQEGRYVIYAAHFETMNEVIAFLTENCCGGAPC